MRHFLEFSCTSGVNTFYVPVPYTCRLQGAAWTSNADPSTNHTVVLSKNGGNTIISGSMSHTPGEITTGTMTSTVADANQELTTAAALKVVITVSATLVLGMWVDLDPFSVKNL